MHLLKLIPVVLDQAAPGGAMARPEYVPEPLPPREPVGVVVTGPGHFFFPRRGFPLG